MREPGRLILPRLGSGRSVNRGGGFRDRLLSRVVIHSPATGYLGRNRELIRRCDMLVAAPQTAEEQESGEIWAMIRYARIRNLATVVLHPESDGARVELDKPGGD